MPFSPTIQAVVVGASAGAIEALSAILPSLPASFPAPILIVVHVPRDRSSVISELFQPKCQLTVKEAEDKEPVKRSVVYFAPPNYHVLVEQDKTLSLSGEEEVMFSRPSIDVLFESAADAYGDGLLGIVLTGANADGAKGLRKVMDAGGRAVVENPETAYVSAMPRAALESCPEAECLDLKEISRFLLQIGSGTEA